MNSDTTRTGPRHLAALSDRAACRWRLHLLRRPADALERVDLPAGELCVGRRPGEGGLRLDDASLSRRHLRIEVSSARQTVLLEDLDSRNGTWLGGRVLRRARAGAGAVIRLGDTVAVLDSHDVEAPPRPTREVPGHSAAAERLRQALALSSPDRAVLLQGATGTGKEHIATALHRRSGRSGRLVRLNVTAIPATLFDAELFGHVRGAFSGATAAREGRFEEADGGSLVLDEIGDLPMALQPKLLRVLEEARVRPVGGSVDRPVDVRVIASTHVDLREAVAAERFRADLYARLAGQVLALPTLAERRADLLALADAVAPLPAGSWQTRLTADALEGLLLLPWPGNLREFAAVLERAARVTNAAVDLGDMPDEVLSAVRSAVKQGPVEDEPTPRPQRPEAAVLRAALRTQSGNIGGVARQFGVDRRQVYRWLEYAGIARAELDSFRS